MSERTNGRTDERTNGRTNGGEIIGPKSASGGGPKRRQGDFLEKSEMSLQYAHYDATLCKKSEQTYERILQSRTNGRKRVNS